MRFICPSNLCVLLCFLMQGLCVKIFHTVRTETGQTGAVAQLSFTQKARKLTKKEWLWAIGTESSRAKKSVSRSLRIVRVASGRATDQLAACRTRTGYSFSSSSRKTEWQPAQTSDSSTIQCICSCVLSVGGSTISSQQLTHFIFSPAPSPAIST
jgi:hypothetical protein